MSAEKPQSMERVAWMFDKLQAAAAFEVVRGVHRWSRAGAVGTVHRTSELWLLRFRPTGAAFPAYNNTTAAYDGHTRLEMVHDVEAWFDDHPERLHGIPGDATNCTTGEAADVVEHARAWARRNRR